LLDIIFNRNSDYAKALNEKKNVIFINKLLNGIFTKGNSQALKMNDKEIRFYLQHLKKVSSLDLDLDFNKFVKEHNSFFIQLIHHSRSYNDKNIKNISNTLYDKYLKQVIPQTVQKYITDCFSTEENVDTFLHFIQDDEFFVVDSRYLDKLLYCKKISETDTDGGIVNWNICSHFIKNNLIETNEMNLSKIFNTFKIFQSQYEFEQRGNQFIKLLNLLNLGNYENSFMEALQTKTTSTKYITPEDYTNLKIIFNRFFENEADSPSAYAGEDAKYKAGPCAYAGEDAKCLQLTDTHIKDIFREYDASNKTNQKQAKLLLILSGIFAKYSSSSLFGTEHESPTSIRYYAYGLMKKAHQLDNNLIDEAEFVDWENRFLGINNAFTCTAVLSCLILDTCKKFDNFSTEYVGIIPPAWS
jgi:hypothetical protein